MEETNEEVHCCKAGCKQPVAWDYICMFIGHSYYCDTHARELDYFLDSAIEYRWERYPKKKSSVMKKPTKPYKPKKPKLDKPVREVTDHYYLWWARKYDRDTKTWGEGYEFTLGENLPMLMEEDGEEYPDGDYAQAEDVPLTFILDWLNRKGITFKDVTIANQVFYRKNDGQIVLDVKRRLTDTEYNEWVDRNQRVMQEYETKLAAHPAKLEQYEADKKQYDIWKAEQRLRELKGT